MPTPAIEFVLDGDPSCAPSSARWPTPKRARRDRPPASASPSCTTATTTSAATARARARGDAAVRPGLLRRAPRRPGRELFRRLAHAAQSRAGADGALRPAAARRADQPSRSRRRAVARGLARSAIPGTLLLITHDRDFLDAVVDLHRAHRRAGSCKPVQRQLFAVRAQRALQLALQQAAYAKQQRQIAHLQLFIDRFRAKATKAKQAQSRIKALERMELIAAAHVDSPFSSRFRRRRSRARQLVKLEHATLGLRREPRVARRRLGDSRRRAHRAARSQRRGQVDAAQGARRRARAACRASG